MMSRTYSELVRLETFDERYRYLRVAGEVGVATFGFSRYLNQQLYHSKDWKKVRRDVIARDNACDLAIADREIFDRIIVHHINPLTIEDLEETSPLIFDMENLICVSHNTHEAIHYGDASLLPSLPVVRYSGDMCPWKKGGK